MNKLNKSGIEFSINLLVTLIISILILSLSIYFLRNLFTAAEEQQRAVDYRTQEQIRALLRDGEKVAIPVTSQIIRRGEAGIFGMGILNIGENPVTFSINIAYAAGYDVDGERLTDPIPPNDFKILYRDTIENLPPNSEEILSISIEAPSSGIEPGTYIFDAVVCYDDGNALTSNAACTDISYPDLYDKIIHKLYVEVP